MRQLARALERRGHPRVERHLPCRLLVNGRVHHSELWDVSASGFFVTTSADLRPGVGVIVVFDTPEGEHFVLEASVPHKRPVARSLADLLPGGVGLHVEQPPPAYLRWAETCRARANPARPFDSGLTRGD
jgi:hypothetical protein